MTKIVELIISEEEMENNDGVFAISLVEEPAIEENWIALNKQKKQPVEFKTINEEKRLLIAPALIPNKQIFRLDDKGNDYYVYFSENTIRQASQLYLKNSYQSSATIHHQKEVDNLTVVESWIKDSAIDKSVHYGFEHLPKGTWFVTMKVENDEVWNMVKDGVVKGFSIEGFFTDKMQNMSKTDDEQIITQIRDILKSEC